MKKPICIMIICMVLFVWFNNRTIVKDNAWDADTLLLVVSNRYKEDTHWLDKCRHPVVICQKQETLRFPNVCDTLNVGREASAYLRFIVNHYDNLPRYVAFLHGHEQAWHQHEDILRRLNTFSPKDCTKDYLSLNRAWIDWTGGDDVFEAHSEVGLGYLDVWKEWFQDELGPPPAPGHNFQHDCCAQFIVSREAILRHPKSSYEKWLRFVSIPHEDQRRAVVIERLWHIIFGEPRVVREEYYYKDFERCFR